MHCLICPNSELHHSQTDIPLTRAEFRLLVRAVPALVCPTCGDAILDEPTALKLLDLAQHCHASGLRECQCDFPSTPECCAGAPSFSQ